MSYNALRKGRYSEPGREYLITTVTAGRRALFSDLASARLFIRELAVTKEQGLCDWLAWIVMPDHFHGLLRLGSVVDLSTVVRYLKARSARRLNKHLGTVGGIWQGSFHDRALRKEEQRIVVARYIIANPLRAGLVTRIGDYPHWDCIWL